MKLSKQKVLQQRRILVSDPRFSRLHFDPRFQRAFKRKLKIPIDSRFRHIFYDKRFADPLAIDKRGRKLYKNSKQRTLHSLHQYYHFDGAEGPNECKGDKVEEEIASKSLQGGNGESAKKGIKERKVLKQEDFAEEDYANATHSVETSNTHAASVEDENYNSDNVSDESQSSTDMSSTTSSSDNDGIEEEKESPYSEKSEEEEEVPVVEKETRRLALVNMDWAHIKAVDILSIMNSFLPKGGHILSVSIYPSEYGLQQMKEEEKHGPQSVFDPNGSDSNDNSRDEINMEKLRRYEKSKLRYYYAVIECDSSGTSDHLYKSCDGIEFERTANTLDLRFIPDDMSFAHGPRDVATQVPPTYEAPVFETKALQHSKVKLTWDDDEPTRVKTLHQKFNAEQLNEMDFKAYLASDVSDDDDGGGDQDGVGEPVPLREHGTPEKEEPLDTKQKARDKYRALLLGPDDVINNNKGSKDMDKEMVITFNSGLEELSKRLMEKRKRSMEEETVWQAHLRKKKEKRKDQKRIVPLENETEEEGDANDPFFNNGYMDEDDPFFKVDVAGRFNNGGGENVNPTTLSNEDKRAQRKAKAEMDKLEEARKKAELELLLADDHPLGSGGGKKGYNLKKRLKEKKKDAEKYLEKLPPVNYDDPRFAAVFTSHHFAIDPTEPEFKRSAVQLRPILERQQMRISQTDEGRDDVKASGDDDPTGAAQLKLKHDLSLLVRSLKRKVRASG